MSDYNQKQFIVDLRFLSSCKNGDLEAAKTLVSDGLDGARIRIDELSGRALVSAASTGQLHIIEYLLTSNDFSPNPSASYSENKALLNAIQTGNKDVVKYLWSIDCVRNDFHKDEDKYRFARQALMDSAYKSHINKASFGEQSFVDFLIDETDIFSGILVDEIWKDKLMPVITKPFMDHLKDRAERDSLQKVALGSVSSAKNTRNVFI